MPPATGSLVSTHGRAAARGLLRLILPPAMVVPCLEPPFALGPPYSYQRHPGKAWLGHMRDTSKGLEAPRLAWEVGPLCSVEVRIGNLTSQLLPFLGPQFPEAHLHLRGSRQPWYFPRVLLCGVFVKVYFCLEQLSLWRPRAPCSASVSGDRVGSDLCPLHCTLLRKLLPV